MTNDSSVQKRWWRGEREHGLRKSKHLPHCEVVGHSPRTHERTSFTYLPSFARLPPPFLWILRSRYLILLHLSQLIPWRNIAQLQRQSNDVGICIRKRRSIRLEPNSSSSWKVESGPSRTRKIVRRTFSTLLLFNRTGRKGSLTMGDSPEKARDWSCLDLKVSPIQCRLGLALVKQILSSVYIIAQVKLLYRKTANH